VLTGAARRLVGPSGQQPADGDEAEPAAAQPGHTITFDGSGSTAQGSATITTWQWAFGDGTFGGPSSTPTISHTYAGAGTFQVTLTVTDSLGRIGRVTVNVTVP